MKRAFLQSILRSSQTVFSFKDLLLSWGPIGMATAKSRVNYYIKSKALIPLRRGLYAKDTHYDRLELATKIFTPSYVSFETVLKTSGIIFQHYETVFIASYQTKEIIVDNHTYSFRKIKNSILTNNDGIEVREHYCIASSERAFLDVLYLNKDYHFDHLAPLDWDKIEDLLPIYGKNKRMRKLITQFRKKNEF